MPANFTGDISSSPFPFPHFWEHTIGSGHAALALRADYQRQLTRCHKELGFEHVRFHGILSDNMGTLVDESNQLIYSFFNADQVIDFLLSIGMAPFVELSFMPLALSSGAKTVFNYKDNVTPPKDYSAWESLISTTVTHWYDRYGSFILPSFLISSYISGATCHSCSLWVLIFLDCQNSGCSSNVLK